MSRAGNYFKTAQAIVNQLAGEKPHSSITDWVEVLSSDRYATTSLDGIPELVESVNILGPQGTTEASRAIRKKLKYGNSHRQIRALVILRALTENCGHGFKLNWANEQLMERLKIMATDVSTTTERSAFPAVVIRTAARSPHRRRGQAQTSIVCMFLTPRIYSTLR